MFDRTKKTKRPNRLENWWSDSVRFQIHSFLSKDVLTIRTKRHPHPVHRFSPLELLSLGCHGPTPYWAWYYQNEIYRRKFRVKSPEFHVLYVLFVAHNYSVLSSSWSVMTHHRIVQRTKSITEYSNEHHHRMRFISKIIYI